MITGRKDIALRLVVVLPGRETGKIITASIENDAGLVLYSATLADVGGGRYEDSGWVPSTVIDATAFFSVYDTVGVLSVVYGDFTEDVVITEDEEPWSGGGVTGNLATLARIRTLAGFRPRRYSGESLGTGTGLATQFSPASGLLFVSPTGDNPGLSEVTVYVDGVAVAVSVIGENVVQLALPPADQSVVTCDMWGHNLSNVEISIVRTEAESEVFGRLANTYTFANLATSPVISKIVSYIAAAMLADIGYNEAGANTPDSMFPPDRLRKVANSLLDEILAGTLVLVDGTFDEIPMLDGIETWIDEHSYGARDRLFENDPFYADGAGVLERYSDSDPWRW